MTKKSDTPAIRFKGFTDTWEQRKLGDVVKEITRNDPESEAPIMMITANNGFIEQSERYAFNNAGESLKKYILLKKGELAYNHGASKLRPYGSCFALTTAENARIPFVYHCFSAENQNAEFKALQASVILTARPSSIAQLLLIVWPMFTSRANKAVLNAITKPSATCIEVST